MALGVRRHLGLAGHPIRGADEATGEEAMTSHQREQQERRAVLANDRKLRPGDHEPSTLHEMANLGIDTDISSGRSKGDYVSGTEKATNYPAIPSGPWSSGYGRLPDEEPLNYSVETVEPVGTPLEVAASMAGTGMARVHSPPAHPSGVDDAALANPLQHIKRRRRL